LKTAIIGATVEIVHFLECGHARRAVAMGDMEHAARLLGERASRPGYGDQQRTRRHCGTKA